MPSWFEFLRIEADIALTLIGVAGVHTSPANSAHALSNARKALAEIQRGLLTRAARGLSEDEVLFLELRCTEIQLALERLTLSN
jgi:cob(I)alamin adenosyltransferase